MGTMSTEPQHSDFNLAERAADQNNRTLNRRNILLGSTTLAAASAMGGTAAQVAQAQAQPAPATGRRPNILVIMGDDIGQTNVSAYSSSAP